MATTMSMITPANLRSMLHGIRHLNSTSSNHRGSQPRRLLPSASTHESRPQMLLVLLCCMHNGQHNNNNNSHSRRTAVRTSMSLSWVVEQKC
jgi:hypothetical protein